MYVENIVLNNFRNYNCLNLKLNSGINIICGNNAQGKTNILEAIYFCATARSHRTNYEKELILWDCAEAHIQMNLYKKRNERIDIHLRKNGKKGIAINKIPIQKLNQFFGILNVVMFSPEDLGLIKKGPKERRKFLDIEICQLNPVYLYNLQQYYKILKQRNNLLKKLEYKKNLIETLFIWDEQLIEYGKKIINIRDEFINKLNDYVLYIHNKITNKKEKLILKYDYDVDKDNFKDKLKDAVEKDKRTGTTSVGPHRDDIIFYVNDIDIRTYGSQGQQRTAALSLKLAEIDLVKDMIDDTPVLLLDDVLSELDESRQKYLLHYLGEIQTILTCTGIEDIINREINVNNIYRIKNGKISI